MWSLHPTASSGRVYLLHWTAKNCAAHRAMSCGNTMHCWPPRVPNHMPRRVESPGGLSSLCWSIWSNGYCWNSQVKQMNIWPLNIKLMTTCKNQSSLICCVKFHNIIILPVTLLRIPFANKKLCFKFFELKKGIVYSRYRYTAYRQMVHWCWGRIGQHIRVPFPACAVTAIRNSFPEADYVGFHYPPLTFRGWPWTEFDVSQ